MDRPLPVKVGSILVLIALSVFATSSHVIIQTFEELVPPTVTLPLRLVLIGFAMFVAFKLYYGSLALVFQLGLFIPIFAIPAFSDRSFLMGALGIVYTLGLFLLLTPTSRKWYASQS